MFGTNNLTRNIVVAMILGAIIGLLLAESSAGWVNSFLIEGILTTGGDIFIRSLKMLVVPLVFLSLIEGVTSLSDLSQLGRVGGKTFGLYLCTTAIAISLALLCASLIQPGMGIELTSDANFQAKEAPSLASVITNIVPSNPIKAMVEGNMLQVIMFAILLGLGINLAGPKAAQGQSFVNQANVVIMNVLTMLMLLAPFGVFCLVTKIFATLGFSAILPLLKYFLVVVAALLLHMLGSYGILLKVLTRLPLRVFYKKVREIWLFAFSTASSNATIPVTMNIVENRLGVHNKVASFTVPLGATINMDGTAIMQGVATVFIAQAYNIPMTITDFLTVIATATLASIGTAGVPGVGLITLAMVLNQVGLPVEGIGLIIGIDRLLDMMRTAVNVTGDALVSCVVGKSEGAFSESIFRDESTPKTEINI